jgi:hypothetical protein
MVVACFGLPVVLPQLYAARWHWFGSVWFRFGEPLSLLPGVLAVGLLAPLVSYRRRDALTVLLVPLAGIRVAWVIGTRLGQLPHRNWPTRESLIPEPSRPAVRIATAVNRYRLWREARTERAAAPARPPWPATEEEAMTSAIIQAIATERRRDIHEQATAWRRAREIRRPWLARRNWPRILLAGSGPGFLSAS